ncbi:MAG: response regulator transcription factor [Campylobacterota bacterium]|nr:response regulator transcription factor [Campylobacterota bacterium]
MLTIKELSLLLKEITILYVEDDIESQKEISDILQKFSDNVLVASNGIEAFDIFNNNEVQLIITDIEMPKMDGIKLVTKIRENDISAPIIMLTVHTQNDYLLSCVNLNIQAYIIKPINSLKLKEALYKIVEYLNLTSNIYIHINHELSYDKINALLISSVDKDYKLNKKEQALMKLLTQNKNKLVTYEQIEQSVWSVFNEVMTSSALRTVVKNLRKKSKLNFIENVSGLGYKLFVKEI